MSSFALGLAGGVVSSVIVLGLTLIIVSRQVRKLLGGNLTKSTLQRMQRHV